MNNKKKTFFQTHKQELIMLPILMGLLIGYRMIAWFISPEVSLYDLFSEGETLIFMIFKLTFYVLAAWMILKIVSPKIHASLVDFYHDYEEQEDSDKKKIALRLFITLLLSLVFLSSFGNAKAAHEAMIRHNLVSLVNTQGYIKERTGNNDHPMIDRMLAHVGLGPRHPWCAAYTSYNLSYCGVPNPMSAWSPAWAQEKDIIWRPKGNVVMEPQPGDCATLYYQNLKRVGHVLFITGEQGGYFLTNEGNTNPHGSRTGGGVHNLKRDKNKIYAVTNYITPYINSLYETATYITDTCRDTCSVQCEDAHIQRYARNGYLLDSQDYHGTGHYHQDSTRQCSVECVAGLTDVHTRRTVSKSKRLGKSIYVVRKWKGNGESRLRQLAKITEASRYADTDSERAEGSNNREGNSRSNKKETHSYDSEALCFTRWDYALYNGIAFHSYTA